MPGRRGRHRRPQPPTRLTQMSVAVTASGATVALPLLGASSADAAPRGNGDKVTTCESGGEGDIHAGQISFNGLQVTQSSWKGHGVVAPRVDPEAGHEAVSGPETWPGCGKRTSLVRDEYSALQKGRTASPEQAKRTDGDARASEPLVKRGRHVKPTGAGENPEVKTGRSHTTSHKVKSGETLSGIAGEHAVTGGWKRLYQANREVIGTDPDLILPGQRLGLPRGKHAAPSRDRAREAPPKPDRSPKARPARPKPKPAKEASTPSRSSHVSPVSGPLGTRYGTAGSSWSSGYHTGQDFPVPVGTSVRSVTTGTVVEAGWGGAYGYQVVVRHTDGHYSQYAHLSSLTVRAGQRVSVGDQLGRSGSTGNSTGPHLHFEVRTGPGYGSDVNPVTYLRAQGVRI